jgi:hypothetical protein
MGTVYRAHDPELNRVVALKLPRFDGPAEVRALAVKRFLREARVAARVRHPHLCAIHDLGEHDGQPYLVMDYVEGGSLARRLKDTGRFEDPRQAAELARQVAEALAALHEHGIVHRDLKPGNILLDAAGRALLTDFGLARPADPGEPLTAEHAVIGTPGYMAPEQAAGEGDGVGPGADVYSLGVVLYQMLTGRPPFTGSRSVVRHAAANELPPPPGRLREGLDPSLEALVLKALARRPEDRFPGARPFADALAGWLAGAGGGRVGRRKRLLVALAAVAIGLLLAALAVTNPFAPGEPGSPEGRGPAVAPPLAGELVVDVSSPPAKDGKRADKDGQKARLPVDAPGALPVRNGEDIHLKARLNRPAHAYLLWVSSQGKVQPLYPWDPKRGFGGPPAAEPPRQEVHSPPELNRGWRMRGKSGLETALLLARATPLEVDLKPLAGRLPEAPLRDPREVAWLEWGVGLAVPRRREVRFRDLDTEEARHIDDAILDLMERLRPHFELLKAVRFAHQGD